MRVVILIILRNTFAFIIYLDQYVLFLVTFLFLRPFYTIMSTGYLFCFCLFRQKNCIIFLTNWRSLLWECTGYSQPLLWVHFWVRFRKTASSDDAISFLFNAYRVSSKKIYAIRTPDGVPRTKGLSHQNKIWCGSLSFLYKQEIGVFNDSEISEFLNEHNEKLRSRQSPSLNLQIFWF